MTHCFFQAASHLDAGLSHITDGFWHPFLQQILHCSATQERHPRLVAVIHVAQLRLAIIDTLQVMINVIDTLAAGNDKCY